MHGWATRRRSRRLRGILDHPSVINLDNVFTIDQRSLGRRVGYLLDDQESTLFRAVFNAFELDD